MTTIRRRHHKHRPHSKLAERRRKLLMFKIIGIAVFLLALATGVVFGLKMEWINIADINIKGNSALATKALESFAEEKISGNYAFVLPKSNILLYPRKDLQESLLDSFKEIKEVDVSFESLQSISVNVEERKPFALYCGIEIATSSDCFFLDEEGFVFTKAPEFSGNVYLKYYGPTSEIGEQYIDVESFREISFFLASLSEIGLKPIIFNIVNEDDFEVELESGGKIMFGQKQSLSSIYENIQSVFGSEEFDEDSLEVLDYADFRFGNKVYFKFKESDK